MSYARSLREAEPTRINPCGVCGTRLRRSRGVYALFTLLVLCTAAQAVPFLRWEAPPLTKEGTAVLACVALVFLANLAGWYFVGWVVVEDPHTP